jgi:GntR family transcriptional repressor for pyruvate dehydrogenase complex
MGELRQRSRPVLRRKLYELVAERIVDDAARGLLKPGDALPVERNLAEQYAVGRSSVREALRTLESQGVIETAGHGTFVLAKDRNPLNQSLELLLAMREGDVRELYEVRRLLEAEMAALAAERRTKRHLERMDASLAEMEAGLASADRYIDADLEFHLAVVSAAGNRVAAHVMRAIRDVTRRVFQSVYHIPGAPERSMEQHRRIFDAVASRDPEAARRCVRDHLERVESDVEAALRDVKDPR